MFYNAQMGNIATPLGSTGLGDGLGQGGFLDMLMPHKMIEKAISALSAKPAAAPATKAPVAFTFCPPGMTPNPQWSAIPEEARSQAAAAGVQACLPGPEGKKGKPQCFFTIGTRKFKCDQGEFSRAYSVARARANKRPSGKASIQLQIGSRTIMIPVRAGVALPGAGAPGTPGAGVPAMRNPMTGAFECSPGMRIAQNAQGQVVCVPTSALPGAPGTPGAAPTYRDRGGRRRGRGRRSRRGGYRDGLGFIHWPSDYQTTMFRQGQYAQGLARYAENGAPLAVTPAKNTGSFSSTAKMLELPFYLRQFGGSNARAR